MEMEEEQQRRYLYPALFHLDSLCRLVLIKESGNKEKNAFELLNNNEKEEEETIKGNVWNHTLFIPIFEFLSAAVKGGGDDGLFEGLNKKDIERLNERLEKLKNNKDGSVMHLYSDLLSAAMRIPPSPQRAHELSNAAGEDTTEGEDGEFRTEKEIIEQALELPSDEVIKFISKQIKRFPLGVLSVARGRRRKVIKANDRNDGDNSKTKNDAKNEMQFYPQVLMVSPFWISEKGGKDMNKGGGASNARQRVVGCMRTFHLMNEKKEICTNNEGNLKKEGNVFNIDEKYEEKDINLVPFPTTFWLSDEPLGAQISKVELTGWMKQLGNGRLLADLELQENFIYDNIRFVALRWILIPKPFMKHFYTANQRCATCTAQKPEGYLSSFILNEKEINKESYLTIENNILGLNRNDINEKETCTECKICTCKLCKLLQCHRMRGIGGLLNFCRIRCLHMHYAFHLICPTHIGNLLDLQFNLNKWAE